MMSQGLFCDVLVFFFDIAQQIVDFLFAIGGALGGIFANPAPVLTDYVASFLGCNL